MGFYPPTENLNVMMRENHKIKSSEYIIICHDQLYIASTTLKENLNMLQDKYKINIYLESIFHMILVEEIFVKSRKTWKNCIQMLICFSKTIYQEIHTLHLKSSSY